MRLQWLPVMVLATVAGAADIDRSGLFRQTATCPHFDLGAMGLTVFDQLNNKNNPARDADTYACGEYEIHTEEVEGRLERQITIKAGTLERAWDVVSDIGFQFEVDTGIRLKIEGDTATISDENDSGAGANALILFQAGQEAPVPVLRQGKVTPVKLQPGVNRFFMRGEDDTYGAFQLVEIDTEGTTVKLFPIAELPRP